MKRESSRKFNDRGQVVIEYLLLLVIVIVIYTTMVNLMTKRDPSEDPEQSGFIIQAWSNMLTTIGSDYADDTDP